LQLTRTSGTDALDEPDHPPRPGATAHPGHSPDALDVSAQQFDLRAIAPQPWKNGAGLTREIAFGGTSSAAFDWRISLAEVERDAPFSAFPGINRCIVLLRGAGMRLRSLDGSVDHALTEALRPFRFSGDLPLDATLAAGTSSDFNVMTRRGVFRSEVSCHRAAAELAGADVTLLLCAEGEWSVTAGASHTLGAMQALLWREPVASVFVEPAIDAPSALMLVRLCQDRQP
jgi:environmental stress-induced protein Ves